MLLRSIRNSLISLSSVWRATPLFMFHQPNLPTSKLTCLKEWKPISITSLQDNPGARRYPKIVGRGPGSGKGKTAGRGVKGHKSRSGGGVSHRFQGGQAQLNRRLPKFRGRKINQQQLDYVNISTLIYYIKLEVLDPSQPITIKTLLTAGIVKKVKYGVKILARGASQLTHPLQLEVTDASKSVINKVNSLGGRVTCVYRTPLMMRKIANPEKHRHAVQEPIPPKRRIKQLDRIQGRGAEVVYNKPEWKVKEDEMDPSLKSYVKKYPVKRYEGMGAGVLKKRRERIPKIVNLNLP